MFMRKALVLDGPRKTGISFPESVGKGKAVAAPNSDPPLSGGIDGDRAEKEIWESFRQAGFLDEASLDKKERDALATKVQSLQNELYDYQYHMGLLLIEKKGWVSKYDQLQQALLEKQEILKREQTAHLMALRDVDKREENFRNALNLKKQCTAHLEKALHEIHSESKEIKFTSQGKMSEHDWASTDEEKSLTVEIKLQPADAKTAEASLKSSDMERKLKEVEAHENALQNEHRFLDAEKQMSETTLSKQNEEFRDWEESLRERELKQVEDQIILNQREKMVNEKDMTLNQKDTNLKEEHKRIVMENLILTRKEEDVKVGFEDLVKKEEDTDVTRKNVETKEKELLALEEMLMAREKLEIQKDEELRKKVHAVEQKELRILHREEKISKRENALEKKLEKAKDLDSKWKALRERENAIRSEKKNLEMEKKQLLNDKEKLQIMNSELDNERAEMGEKQLELHKELEKLKVTKEERKELQQLQSELKHEKEKCMFQEELLMKENEALKQDKESYVTTLDEERSELDKSQGEHQQMLCDLELQKKEFEVEMQSRLEKMENDFLEKQKTFKEERERELKNINHLREVVDKEMKGMNNERLKIEKVKNDTMDTGKKLPERKHLELQKEINNLKVLIKKLKGQREKFKEVLEKHKSCNNCGEVNHFILSGFQTLQETEEKEVHALLRSPKECTKVSVWDSLITSERRTETSPLGTSLNSGSSGGKLSWLHKCSSKILHISPFNRSESTIDQSRAEESPPSIVKVNIGEKSREVDYTENEIEPSVRREDTSLEGKELQWDVSDNEVKDQPTPFINEHSSIEAKEIQQSQLKTMDDNRGKKRRPGVRRTRSLKAVVEDAKIILGKDPEQSADKLSSGNTEYSVGASEGSRLDATFADKGSGTVGLKRQLSHASGVTSEQDPDGKQSHSHSVEAGKRRKRRQTISQVSQTSAEKRYNLRPRK